MENIVKDFWNTRPCNIGHSKKNFLSKEYFNEITEKRYLVENHIPEFCQFEKYKDKKVLEIGCGIGTDAIMFAKEGCEYHGLELSDKSLEITKQRFKVYDLPGKFYNINSENMSIFEDNYFDLVYSFGVIHHTENPEKVLDEVYRILKPDGEAKIMLYAKDSWKQMMIDNGMDQYEAQSDCPIAYSYSKNEIFELFNKFNNINIKQAHIFPYKIPEYKENKYVMTEYFASMPETAYKSLKEQMGWHLCITCHKIIGVISENCKEEINLSPWKHIRLSYLFNHELMMKAKDDFPSYNDKYWDTGKHFVNEHTDKKEIADMKLFPSSLQKITNYLISPEFVHRLEKLTGLYNLLIDENIYGGGMTISNEGSSLQKHIDFNFNDELKLYRAVNLILYFNNTGHDMVGGNFDLYEMNNNKTTPTFVKGIMPSFGNMIIFCSNNKTIHGFSKIEKGERKSLNLWYYTKKKPSYVDHKPHRTIWL